MHHPLIHNARKLTTLIRSLQIAFLTSNALLLVGVAYFAHAWQRALHSEVAYFVSPQGTHAAYKRPEHQQRDTLEIEHFVGTFLQHAFAHSEFTYKGNLEAALLLMDRRSGLYLKSKFTPAAVEEVYVLQNGISTVLLERMELNTENHPYEVAAYYQTTLHFVGTKEEQLAKSGVYFRLTEVARSPQNPYGLTISHFNFITYEQ